jgi:hypothetical protein
MTQLQIIGLFLNRSCQIACAESIEQLTLQSNQQEFEL